MLHLFNSMGRQAEVFVPRDPGHVRMYVCRPAVRSFANIGIARLAAVFDVLARVLRAGAFNDKLAALGVEVEDAGGESRWRMRA